MAIIEEREKATSAPATPMSTRPSGKNRVSFWTRKAERPTYELVAELERFDERDTIFARADLVEDSELYKRYYAVRPELEEGDRQTRPFPTIEAQARQRAKVFQDEPFSTALSNTVNVAQRLGDKVDGRVFPERVEVDPQPMTRKVKGLARYLGADLVGVSLLNPAWVYSHKGRGLFSGVQWGDPVTPDHRYAISMAFAHDFPMLLAARGNTLASNVMARNVYDLMAVAAVRLASFIRALGYPARAHIVSNYQVLQVPLAIDAGLGELGRLGILMTKELGASVRLVTVTTDLPLEPDRPVDIGVQDFCQKCLKCADVCPTGAVPRGDKEVVRGVRKWRIDPLDCFRYWASRGRASCLYCVSACPWTKPRNLLHRASAEMAARSGLSRRFLIWLDDRFYGRHPQAHPYPEWLSSTEPGLKQRLSSFLHKL